MIAISFFVVTKTAVEFLFFLPLKEPLNQNPTTQPSPPSELLLLVVIRQQQQPCSSGGQHPILCCCLPAWRWPELRSGRFRQGNTADTYICTNVLDTTESIAQLSKNNVPITSGPVSAEILHVFNREETCTLAFCPSCKNAMMSIPT